MNRDAKVSVYDLKSVLKRFRDQRNWQQFHDPKNLAEAIAIEASELLELFLWKNPAEIEVAIKKGKTFQREIENELADVFCFSFNLANALDLDVSSIRDDQIRFLHRHVAIDAIFPNLRAQFRKLAAILLFVTLQALHGVRRRLTFRRMHIVTRGAGHLRRRSTPPPRVPTHAHRDTWCRSRTIGSSGFFASAPPGCHVHPRAHLHPDAAA